MDWKAQNKEDRQTMQRMAARLVGLATLAERASTHCRFVRLLVLWILRPGVDIARRLVVETLRDTQLPDAQRLTRDFLTLDTKRHNGTPADAVSLGLALRTFALAIEALAEILYGSAALTTSKRRPVDKSSRYRARVSFHALLRLAPGGARGLSLSTIPAASRADLVLFSLRVITNPPLQPLRRHIS